MTKLILNIVLTALTGLWGWEAIGASWGLYDPQSPYLMATIVIGVWLAMWTFIRTIWIRWK